jgi:hypothetical protein
MGLHLKYTSDLDVPVFDAVHEGRVVLVGNKQRKRVLHETPRGAFYVKMGSPKSPNRKRYLSSGGLWVITAGTRDTEKK